MNNVAATRTEPTSSQTAGSPRCPKAWRSTLHATEVRKSNNASPGNPRGNIEKSRCTGGRLRYLRTAGYPNEGNARIPLLGDSRCGCESQGAVVECRQ